ncbi:MAG: hypothetical protein ACP5JH_06805 [Bacteroidota bacterium]
MSKLVGATQRVAPTLHRMVPALAVRSTMGSTSEEVIPQDVLGGSGGVFVIQMPTEGIRCDVFADAVQGFFIADDAFVIIALP